MPQSIRYAAGNAPNPNPSQLKNTTVKFTYDEIKGGPDGQKGKATVFLLDNNQQNKKKSTVEHASPLKLNIVLDKRNANTVKKNGDMK